MQLPPSFFASASPSRTRRPAMTILAPSATKNSAVRRPMPLVAPVITPTLPSSRPMSLPLSIHNRHIGADITDHLKTGFAQPGDAHIFRSAGLNLDRLIGLIRRMRQWFDDFRRGWQGISQPPLSLGVGFATLCLALSTAARFGLSLIRPDVFFTPYIPAVFFATAVGGVRVGIATTFAGGMLGVTVNFGDARADFARFALLAIFWLVCGLMMWGVDHYRSIAAQQRQISKRLIEEEEYRRLIVAELQHR